MGVSVSWPSSLRGKGRRRGVGLDAEDDGRRLGADRDERPLERGDVAPPPDPRPARARRPWLRLGLWPRRRPSRARASALRVGASRRSRRTRCAGPEARRGRRRCRGRRLPSRAAPRSPWRRPPPRRSAGRRTSGSVITRQTLVLDASPGPCARKAIQGVRADQVGDAPRHWRRPARSGRRARRSRFAHSSASM